jgi:hypothetical protein
MNDFNILKGYSDNSDRLRCLERIRSKGGSVRIRYENNAGEQSERTIEPIHIYRNYGKWYVKAYCHLREEERTFAVRRMDILHTLEPDLDSQDIRDNREYGGEFSTTDDTISYDPSSDRFVSAGRSTEARNSSLDTSRPVEIGVPTPWKREERPPALSFFSKVFWTIFFIIGSFLMVLFWLEETGAIPEGNEPDSTPQTVRVSSSDSAVPSFGITPVPPKQWTYRGFTLLQWYDGSVLVPELKLRGKNGRSMHYLINAALFVKETGIGYEELLYRYMEADSDGNGHLSWREICFFQNRTSREFSYRSNSLALPPDEFLRRGGGDCEDFAIYTCGMLRFWGWNCQVASYYPPSGGNGHAITLVWSGTPIGGYGYFKIEEGAYVGGKKVRPGYWIPIDYDAVGGITNAMGSDWELWDLEDPEALYWREM